MKPYYEDGSVTLYHGDCREVTAWTDADVLVNDPPYGISYRSGARRQTLAASISNDTNTAVRDYILEQWGTRPAIVFGTWRIPRPIGTRARLIWDTKGALGMGALDLPWKPASQEVYILGMEPDEPSEEVYVLGKGFTGRRDSDVLTVAPVQSLGYNGRTHPHEKPVDLMLRLIDKCPPGVIADPTCGVSPTLVAAKQLGRRAVGVEENEAYCEIAAKRLAQDVLFGGAA